MKPSVSFVASQREEPSVRTFFTHQHCLERLELASIANMTTQAVASVVLKGSENWFE